MTQPQPGGTTAYKDFTLNADGLANISKTGTTLIGERKAQALVWATKGARLNPGVMFSAIVDRKIYSREVAP